MKPILVRVDAERAAPDRLPIADAGRGYEFGQPAVAEIEGRRIHGVIGWDPKLGWVLVVREEPEGAAWP